jgi:ABC-type Fe3+/spermidine/putrescine transport system ATPase subunit
VRPESFRINAPDGHNTLFGRVESSTYLGETAQLVMELAGGVRVKASMLNPRDAAPVGSKVTLSADPDDLVVLPRP